MSHLHKRRFSLSLIQAIIAIFVTLGLLVAGLSVVSQRGIERVGSQFEQLSEQALPLAMTNAELIQNLLTQVKVLNLGMQSESSEELSHAEQRYLTLASAGGQYTGQLFSVAGQLHGVIGEGDKQQLEALISDLSKGATRILASQQDYLATLNELNKQVPGFRYGVSSIGPEMNRVSMFLVQDNPEASDAANRFIASASAMESTFLMLLMEEDIDKARKEYRELGSRKAGLELAFDDFAQWHPDVNDFASLTAPYQMVQEGFKDGGVLKLAMKKIELVRQQKVLLREFTTRADEVIEMLNQISAKAGGAINSSEQLVYSTIKDVTNMLVIVSAVIITLILASGWFLRRWTNRGLKNITHQLGLLNEHVFNQRSELIGPSEMRVIAGKLNRVIDSTRESLSVVTENCETLYQTAEISHAAAEKTHSSLEVQNDSLSQMVTTVSELQAAIQEIAQVTGESSEEARIASEHSLRGSRVIDENRQRLQLLESTLESNEVSMRELDQKVKEISEMVDMISNIAENTNLLALNAAIEAARAGEQGRGFAVVADEVRNLASNTSTQTSNIREMMQALHSAADSARNAVVESRNEMNLAMSSGEDVKSTFSGIEAAIEQINLRVAQISVATEQQERATAEVSGNIRNITELGSHTKLQLDAMIESAEQVAEIGGHQQAMLHKYELR